MYLKKCKNKSILCGVFKVYSKLVRKIDDSQLKYCQLLFIRPVNVGDNLFDPNDSLDDRKDE